MKRDFDTDKLANGYVPLYVERIRDPRRILEVGVKAGGSLLLWCDLWPSVEMVIGVDINEPIAVPHAKITVVQADQADGDVLARIGADHGPFDLVIDDASHHGLASWATFQALWQHVRPGGAYVVEDWGTGYWEWWSDGESYSPQPPPGHRAGMAGMVKRLVDEIDNGDVARLELLSGLAFAFKKEA